MEKKTLTLLAIQMGSVIGDMHLNLKKVENLLNNTLRKKNADFVFLPEVWTSGWDCESFTNCAEALDNSQALNLLKNIAKNFSTNIVGGSIILKKDQNTLVNALPVINRKGELVSLYEKNHLFSYYGSNEGDYITAGKKPILVSIEGVKLGLTICYDIRFPEIYRAYRKAGADILINVAAWGANKKIPWDTMTKSRAIENQTYMVALTQTGTLKDGSKNLGHSMVIDYNGNILSEINDIEGGFYAEINLNEMYDFREKCTILKDIRDSYEVEIQ